MAGSAFGKGDSTSNGGIGFFGLLTITFIVLKLTHVIDWSWWLVLAPIWVPGALVLLILLAISCIWIWLGYDNYRNTGKLK